MRLLLAAGVLILASLWLGLPVLRAYNLLHTSSSSVTAPPAGLPVQSIKFRATDGATLSGWLMKRAPRAPTVILIPGYKGTRSSMVRYARFLWPAGFNVLLYDSRGTGASGGVFSLGLREPDDVYGAIRYLESRRDLPDHRYGLLGVSLGAGVAIIAAARDPAIAATIADSAPIDENAVVDRLNTLHLGPLPIPLAPIGPWAVDRFLGGSLSSFSPRRSVHCIAPRALYLIHSQHDTNPTTPPSDALALRHAAGQPVFLWLAPKGGHAGALTAQPAQYERSVVGFFRRYLSRAYRASSGGGLGCSTLGER